MTAASLHSLSNISDHKEALKTDTTFEPDVEKTATLGTEHHGSSTDLPADNTAGYHRSLTRRKVMMMTFGAGIGTGLWVGTGQALYYGKPKLM